MIRRRLLPTFQGIASQSSGGNVTTATCDLTLGLRYHALWLELGDNGGTTLASGNLIGDIRLKINGKVQRTHSGVELNALQAVNGSAFGLKTSGTPGAAAYRTYLPIYFSQPWRKVPADVGRTSIFAGGIESLQLEVDIKAGLTSPVLTGWFEYEPLNSGERLGALVKWIRQSLAATGTTQTFSNLDKRDFIEAIHLFPTVEGTPKYVNLVQFSRNNEYVTDKITTLENQATLLGREMQPDTAATPRYDLVFDYDDPINSALLAEGLREMSLYVEYNAAASGTMIAMILRNGPPE